MAAAKQGFDVEALWRIERIGAVSLSPDGAQAVCSVSRFSMEANASTTRLELLSAFGGAPRTLTRCGEKDGQAAWSPTGAEIAFVARREQEGKKDEAPQLYLQPGLGARNASVAIPYLVPNWQFDPKRPALVR